MKATKISVPFPAHYFDKKAAAANLLICGIDEVGRGCLAGPVVVAAAILKPSVLIETPPPRITDSKKMSAAQRDTAYAWLIKNSWYAIASIGHRTIDQENIYSATLVAMQRAVAQLWATTPQLPAAIFVDAMPLELDKSLFAHTPPPLTEFLSSKASPTNGGRAQDDPLEQPWGKIISFCHGEEQCLAIAAASIIAKVTRDRTMEKLENVFPGYELAAHKGYATPTHKNLVISKGLSLIHRKSFCGFLEKPQEITEQIPLFPASQAQNKTPFEEIR